MSARVNLKPVNLSSDFQKGTIRMMDCVNYGVHGLFKDIYGDLCRSLLLQITQSKNTAKVKGQLHSIPCRYQRRDQITGMVHMTYSTIVKESLRYPDKILQKGRLRRIKHILKYWETC